MLILFLNAILICNALNASVIVLMKQHRVYSQFELVWSMRWPNLSMHVVDAVSRSKRGHGVCLSLVNALESDLQTSQPSFIFEPDALPFDDVTYTQIDLREMTTYDVYFLGGHNVFTARGVKLTEPWTNVQQIFGCFAFVVPAKSRDKIFKTLQKYCNKPRTHYDVDVVLSRCFDSVVATPLLVDHPKSAYSETWSAVRERHWAGVRQWWKFPPVGKFFHKNEVCLLI